MTSLVYFANVTLSSFYFDIRKDCLYADSVRGMERRGAVTVLEKVLIQSEATGLLNNFFSRY